MTPLQDLREIITPADLHFERHHAGVPGIDPHDYVYRAMPQDAPGSLTPEKIYSLTAFLLHANEVIPEDAVMSAETLPQVEMPARARFVRDDRRGRNEIR